MSIIFIHFASVLKILMNYLIFIVFIFEMLRYVIIDVILVIKVDFDHY